MARPPPPGTSARSLLALLHSACAGRRHSNHFASSDDTPLTRYTPRPRAVLRPQTCSCWCDRRRPTRGARSTCRSSSSSRPPRALPFRRTSSNNSPSPPRTPSKAASAEEDRTPALPRLPSARRQARRASMRSRQLASRGRGPRTPPGPRPPPRPQTARQGTTPPRSAGARALDRPRAGGALRRPRAAGAGMDPRAATATRAAERARVGGERSCRFSTSSTTPSCRPS